MWPLRPPLGQFEHQRSVTILPAGGPVPLLWGKHSGEGRSGHMGSPAVAPAGTQRACWGGALAPSCPLVGCVALARPHLWASLSHSVPPTLRPWWEKSDRIPARGSGNQGRASVPTPGLSWVGGGGVSLGLRWTEGPARTDKGAGSCLPSAQPVAAASCLTMTTRPLLCSRSRETQLSTNSRELGGRSPRVSPRHCEPHLPPPRARPAPHAPGCNYRLQRPLSALNRISLTGEILLSKKTKTVFQEDGLGWSGLGQAWVASSLSRGRGGWVGGWGVSGVAGGGAVCHRDGPDSTPTHPRAGGRSRPSRWQRLKITPKCK